MTLLLRKQRAQDRVEGREPLDWSDDDYAVVDDTVIGRIYKERVPAGEKWRWFLQVVPAPPPKTSSRRGTAPGTPIARQQFVRCHRSNYARLRLHTPDASRPRPRRACNSTARDHQGWRWQDDQCRPRPDH